MSDQRAVADRTDMLTYQTQVLKAPVRISGAPIADLYAATSGTDADRVVKPNRRVSGRSARPAGDGRL